MQSYGEGAQAGMQAYKAAQGANLTAQEKYHNLMGKINETKMNQQNFLANYHNQMKHQEAVAKARNLVMHKNHDASDSQELMTRAGLKKIEISASSSIEGGLQPEINLCKEIQKKK